MQKAIAKEGDQRKPEKEKRIVDNRF